MTNKILSTLEAVVERITDPPQELSCKLKDRVVQTIHNLKKEPLECHKRRIIKLEEWKLLHKKALHDNHLLL